jgi:hypothetical protein
MAEDGAQIETLAKAWIEIVSKALKVKDWPPRIVNEGKAWDSESWFKTT